MFRIIFIIIPLIFIISLLLGYYPFYSKIFDINKKSLNEKNRVSFDGIAVLTGGKGRIRKALKILVEHPQTKLIISGVDEKVFIKSLTSNEDIIDKIYLDKVSKSTLDNAFEIVDWARKLDLKKIKVITSYYHMPRSIMLLKHFGKDLSFIPMPVSPSSRENTKLIDQMKLYAFLFEEYCKYILSYPILFFY